MKEFDVRGLCADVGASQYVDSRLEFEGFAEEVQEELFEDIKGVFRIISFACVVHHHIRLLPSHCS